ncbi:MAG: hypothetical protein QOJ94_2325 [Sphingomonadales bacterium]|jgi:hypothetical protein|nr:hypothetical protein [Sphingomonadales bacterium]
MASVELNKLLMRAVSDAKFRDQFLADPASAAKSAGVSADAAKEVGNLDMRRLRTQFDHISRVSTDLLGSIVSAGHSNDHLDRSNIHDNDGHIHDKAADSLGGIDAIINPAERAIDPRALRDALQDPAILKEFESNAALKAALKNAIR